MVTKTQQKRTKQAAGSSNSQNTPAAKSPHVSGAKDKTASKQKAAAELAAELKNIRTAVKETVKQINLRIDSGLAGTLSVLEKKQKPEDLCGLPKAKAAEQMVKKLRALKVKPVKGRLKDIAQIEQIVKKIAKKIVKKQ